MTNSDMNYSRLFIRKLYKSSFLEESASWFLFVRNSSINYRNGILLCFGKLNKLNKNFIKLLLSNYNSFKEKNNHINFSRLSFEKLNKDFIKLLPLPKNYKSFKDIMRNRSISYGILCYGKLNNISLKYKNKKINV